MGQEVYCIASLPRNESLVDTSVKEYVQHLALRYRSFEVLEEIDNAREILGFHVDAAYDKVADKVAPNAEDVCTAVCNVDCLILTQVCILSLQRPYSRETFHCVNVYNLS